MAHEEYINSKLRDLGADATSHPGYLIQEFLGEGGQARVVRAHDLSEYPTSEQFNVAIKLFDNNRTQVAIRRFEEEAMRTQKWTHPNIVAMFRSGVGEVDLGRTSREHPMIVMEHANDGSLKKLIHTQAPLAANKVVILAEQIAAGLKYAHDRSVVHRDLKPANILLRNGAVKLADFGIAKSLAPGIDHDSTLNPIGTPQYMSPEQFYGKSSFRTDQYALAVTVFELLTGQLPFIASNTEGYFHAHNKLQPPAFAEILHPAELTEEVRALETVVRKALSKKPEERFEDVTKFAKALHDAHQNSHRAMSQPTVIPQPTARTKSYLSAAEPTRLISGDGLRESAPPAQQPNRRKFLQFAGVVAASTLAPVGYVGVETGKHLFSPELHSYDQESVTAILDDLFKILVQNKSYDQIQDIGEALTSYDTYAAEQVLKFLNSESKNNAAWVASSLARYKPDVALDYLNRFSKELDLNDSSSIQRAVTVAAALAPHNPAATQKLLSKIKSNSEFSGILRAALGANVPAEFAKNSAYYLNKKDYGAYEILARLINNKNKDAFKYPFDASTDEARGVLVDIGKVAAPYAPDEARAICEILRNNGDHDLSVSVAMRLGAFMPTATETAITSDKQTRTDDSMVPQLSMSLAKTHGDTLKRTAKEWDGAPLYKPWLQLAEHPSNQTYRKEAIAALQQDPKNIAGNAYWFSLALIYGHQAKKRF